MEQAQQCFQGLAKVCSAGIAQGKVLANQAQQAAESAKKDYQGASSSGVVFKMPKDGESLFQSITEAPPDPILNTAIAFKNDTDPRKVNLGIGAYRTEEGKPWVLPVVVKAEEQMLRETGKTVDKEYIPIDGLPSLKECTQRLIFGEKKPNVASSQALSGTGALRIVGEFMNQFLGIKKIYYSDPTWGNHPTIFQKSGMVAETYPYWDAQKKGLRFDDMLNHMKNAPDGSVYLLHPCAHNPTGVDPSMAQWQQILDVCLKKKHIPIMDSAYQGYATGSLENDRKSIELFYNSGMEFFVCQSFAKNLGLYGERIGMVHVVCKNEERARVVLSQMKMVIRPMYSSPPCHGAHLVSIILNDPSMYKQWVSELKIMSSRILESRSNLRSLLEKKKTPGTWNHVTDQIGMFSFTGLSPEQCEILIKEHHIYLLKSGRISLAGINKANVEYVANAINDVVTRKSAKL